MDYSYSLVLYGQNNEPFLSPPGLSQQAKQAQQGQAVARQRAEQADQEIQRLRVRLRELGIDPDQLL